MTVHRLLWIDCAAALAGGIGLALLADWLGAFTGLPVMLILRQSRINLVYSLFSFGLTRLSPCPRPWLATLVVANFSYALYCLALLFHYASRCNPWGWLYLVLEASLVAALASWEWRVFFPSAAEMDGLQQSFRPPG